MTVGTRPTDFYYIMLIIFLLFEASSKSKKIRDYDIFFNALR